MTANATEALERATRTLGEMAALAGERGLIDNQRRWDRLVDEWLADWPVLAATDEGRAALTSLLADPRPAVRLWAAAAVLSWDPESARPVLVAIREFPLQFDLHAITAKHTLLAYDAGTLEAGTRLPGT